MEKLIRVQHAIWYGYLSGHYTYDFACDLYETLIPAKSELRKEEK